MRLKATTTSVCLPLKELKSLKNGFSEVAERFLGLDFVGLPRLGKFLLPGLWPGKNVEGLKALNISEYL